MLMFVDVETSGLLKRDLPLSSPEQPWICSIAAQLTEDDGTPVASLNTGIRANGRRIGAGAEQVHGINSRRAGRTGISELAALAVLCGKESFASQASMVIGHGVSFDRDVIVSVLARHDRDPATFTRPGLVFSDTMLAATPFCRIPSDHPNGGYKWPSLDDCSRILLEEQHREGRHSAWDDLQRTKRLFYWLRERGAFEMPEAA